MGNSYSDTIVGEDPKTGIGMINNVIYVVDTTCIMPYRKFLEFACGNFRDVLNIPEKYKAPVVSVKLKSYGHTNEFWNVLKCTLSNNEIMIVDLYPPARDGDNFSAIARFGNKDCRNSEKNMFRYVINAQSYTYARDV